MKIALILIGIVFLLKLIKIVYKKRKSDYKLDLQYNKNLFRSSKC